ncbi:hypothetical protein [Pseudarthrobacter polychromogenes]|uniref:hypothetical protein n=1 Tax=Pseudarthrobacter polychromogenes TaxID=1676 RepID=UPI0016649E5A|nr:hypothetical protein [Pseudarthrobacter polychromogenes]
MPPDHLQPGGAQGSPPGRPHRRFWAGLAAAAAAAALVTGAVSVFPGLSTAGSDEATLRGFQIRVLNVTQAAAENRLDGVLDALEALERDLDLAAGQGSISAARYRGIDAALEAVRADVTRTITAQSASAADAKAAVTTAEAPAAIVATPEPEPVPEYVQSQPVQLQPEAPAAAPVPAPEPAPQEQNLPDAAKEAREKGKGVGKP